MLAPTCVCLVAAQGDTPDPLEIFASEVLSIYTEATSILASAVSKVSEAIASTSSSYVDASSTYSSWQPPSTPGISLAVPEASPDTATSSRPSSPSFSLSSITSEVSSLQHSQPSSSTSSQSFSTSVVSPLILPSSSPKTSSVLGAAAQTSTSDPSMSRADSHSSKLAIILGCVLGALALGMTILTILLCRQRRHHGQSPRHRALSPGDDEVESWRLNQPSVLAGSTDSSRHMASVPGAAPLMSDHPAFRNSAEHENPFVPVVPPPRRTAPNSRAGLTDGTVPGDDPFLMEKETGVPTSPRRSRASNGDARKPTTLAAALAVAAARDDLLHRQKNVQATVAELGEKDTVEAEPQYSISRKPVPVNHVNNSEPWPYSPVSPIDPNEEMGALVNIPATRERGEHRRSSSRDAARANAAFDNAYTQPDAGHAHELEHDVCKSPAIPPAGSAVGAAAGAGLTLYSNHPFSGTSGGRSPRRSQSPQRQSPIIPHAGSFDPSSSLNDSDNRRSYSKSPTSKTRRHTASPTPSPISKRVDTPQQAAVSPQPRPLPQSATPTPPPVARSTRRNSAAPALGTGAAVLNVNRPAVPSPLSSEVRRDRSHSPPRIWGGKAERPNSHSSFPSTVNHNNTTSGMAYRKPRRPSAGPRAGSHYSYGYTQPQSYDSIPSSHYEPSYPGDLIGVPVENKRDVYIDIPVFDGTQSSLGKTLVGDSRYPHMGAPQRKSYSSDNLAVTDLEPSRDDDYDYDSTYRLCSGMPAGWPREKPAGGGGGYGYMRDSGIGGLSGGRRRLRASDFARETSPTGYQGHQGVGEAL